MNKISIIGAGGHTRSSINLLKHTFPDSEFYIFDDSYVEGTNETIHSIPVLGKIDDLYEDTLVFLSVGDNAKRRLLYDRFISRIIQQNSIHPCSFVESPAMLGIANQIFAQAYINSYVEIGNNNIINTAAILEHEVTIGSHNHISVGAKICGRVFVGNRCLVGAGATLIDKIKVCDDVVIGAGAVVVSDICVPGTYVGAPARPIK